MNKALNKSDTRKLQLVEATVQEIGAHGSMNVTVGQIAKRAGVSSALAFHYFGDKDQLFLGAMRHILTLYGAEVRGGLRLQSEPMPRLEAIVRPNFTPSNFKKETIAAWMNFYVMAQYSVEAQRLLRIYHRRLQSNLTHALRPIAGEDAPDIAMRIGALIDGLYLRAIRDPDALSGAGAYQQTIRAIHQEIKVNAK